MKHLALLLLSLGGAAHAAGVQAPGQAPPQLADYLEDLDSGDQAKRRLAARTLRTMVKVEVKRSARVGGDDLQRDEALLSLQDFDKQLAPRCMEYLAAPALAVPCADILRLLETTEALPALREAAATTTRRRALRRLRRTIDALELYAMEGM